jgi:hypothetical protein
MLDRYVPFIEERLAAAPRLSATDILSRLKGTYICLAFDAA